MKCGLIISLNSNVFLFDKESKRCIFWP